jgi:hypothetical protein
MQCVRALSKQKWSRPIQNLRELAKSSAEHYRFLGSANLPKSRPQSSGLRQAKLATLPAKEYLSMAGGYALKY